MRRWWILATVAVISVAGGAWAWRAAESGTASASGAYRLGAVDRGAIVASVSATGTVTPVSTVLVSSQLSGLVIDIRADYNASVREGDILARLDAQQFRSRAETARAETQVARAALETAKAKLERVRASAKRAQSGNADVAAQRVRTSAQLAEAMRALDRQIELNQRGATSRAALDTAQTQVDVLRATLASNDAQIGSAAADVEAIIADVQLSEADIQSATAMVASRVASLRTAEIDLSRADIRSPVTGVVVQRQVELGQTVASSLAAPTLFTIAEDLRRITIYANVDESDVGRITPGLPVTFTVNAFPGRNFAGRVKQVRLGSQTIQNVVIYTAVIDVENADMALLPGMTASLRIVTQERRDVLRIPNAALRWRPAGTPRDVAAPAPPPSPFGDAPSGPARGGTPSTAPARAMADFIEAVRLEVQPTAEQMAAIEKILAEQRSKFAALSGESGDRRIAAQRLREAAATDIAAALDPARRERFAALRDRLSDRRRTGMARAVAESPGMVSAGMAGLAFVLNEANEAKSVPIRIGATDGTFTEILSGDITERSRVIVGGGGRTAAPATPSPRLF